MLSEDDIKQLNQVFSAIVLDAESAINPTAQNPVTEREMLRLRCRSEYPNVESPELYFNDSIMDFYMLGKHR